MATRQLDNTIIRTSNAEFYRQRVETYSGEPALVDTAGITRVSQRFTLFDGKIMTAEDTAKWDTKGTGTSTFSGNSMVMGVTAGQYVVRQGRFFTPYFSGKPQVIEATSVNLANQTGVVKRFGYFSSNAVAPYDSNKDGAWVEADGTTYRLITSNNDTETHNVPWTEWDAFSEISNYDWTKFSVSEIDFLWLGGAALRLFLVVNGTFKLVHTIRNHAGYASNLIMLYPNQPMRYEIRSTSGTGSFTSVCSMVSTEGTKDEQGQGISTYNLNRACNTTGTDYVMCAIRKSVTYRNHHIILDTFSSAITGATSDSGVMFLCINPTYSAPLTWSANSRIEQATPTTQTATSLGRVLRAVPIVSNGVTEPAPLAALRTLSVGIDNVMGELVLVYRPLTSNQTVSASMMSLEY